MSNTTNDSKPKASSRPNWTPNWWLYNRDGPWLPHPSFLDEKRNEAPDCEVVGRSMKEYRASYKNQIAQLAKYFKESRAANELGDYWISHLTFMWPHIDMTRYIGRPDGEIESALERHYIGAQYYLTPNLTTNNTATPFELERFGPDWGQNARGIYYRHYYSPAWVTPGHNLWIPSLDGVDWNHFSEYSRGARAETFLKHVLNNERWKKSEYAWEADAWTDVFGQMRDDPVLAVDKHEYNTIQMKRDPVSCKLAGKPKFIKRIPDATFGLATFKPADYQSLLAEWDLDHDRLQAMLLHRHCGLISDPHWGDMDLAFPFAVYEAKSWSGNAQEARRQGCSAGMAYLDMLDSLVKKPGQAGKKNRAYQSTEIRNNQVFVFTSFGAHWHILVGYKRPRNEREYAGHEGFSESVYIFQRIWSGRVVTIRKAWELLSLVDQIHLWGVTEFRSSIIQYLKPWHEFSRICYTNDAVSGMKKNKADRIMKDGEEFLPIPEAAKQLADWVEHVTKEDREDLSARIAFHFLEQYQGDLLYLSHSLPTILPCVYEDCRPGGWPAYPLLSKEDMVEHYRQIHGEDDERIALIEYAYHTEGLFNGNNTHAPQKRKRSRSEKPWPRSKSAKLSSSKERLVGRTRKAKILDMDVWR